jgi:outer membrane receptor protein involved in Fe transport
MTCRLISKCDIMKTIFTSLLLFLFFLAPTAIFAQDLITVDGSVKDHQQSIPAATVLLYTVKDSSLISTAITDGNGKFNFRAKSGNYYLVATSVGYDKVTTKPITLNAEKIYSVPPITLTETAKNLNEVVISGARPVLERKADKLVFNIDATPSTAGLNALEVLKKAPGVVVDHNENISLSGKSNVLVTIDGKQTYLSEEEVVNLLKSMQSSEIESIEIMNNPGARYEANSTGGVINIKTKKSKADGFNGSVALGGGYNSLLSSSNSLNLNYRKKSFNVFGSYGYYSNQYRENLMIDRVTANTENPLYFSQRNADTSQNNSHNFKIGTDFFISPKHTIGFLVKGNINDRNQQSYSVTNIGNSYQQTDSILKTPSYNTADRKNFSYNLNYKGVLDTAGQEITIDADYSTYDGNNFSSYKNRFFLPDGAFFKNGQIYRNLAPSEINIKAIKTDYVLPLNKTWKLEAGLKYANVESDNNFIFENEVGNGWLEDPNRSNRFVYSEDVAAAYSTLSATLGKMSIQAGLRLENTHSVGNSITLNEKVDRNYTNLFPSVFISRNFNENNILNFSYSRKINRPNYQNLNPFLYYLDQYTYNQGNPNLRPEFATNFETTYLFKQKYSVALAYSHTSDVITQILLQNAALNSMYQTTLNLASDDVVSLTLNFPITISKWWNINNNVLGYFKQIKAPDLNGVDLNSSQYTANIYMQHNFTLSKLFSADASFFYSTPQIDGAYNLKTLFTSDAGLRYNFPNKAGNLKLGVSDVFHSQKARIVSTLEGNEYNLRQWGTSTSVRLTFTYRFGKSTVKSARNRETGLDAEQKRLGQ